MPTVTKPGRNLREELNDAFRRVSPDAYIPFDRLDDVSLLMRRAARYAKRQENACSYEWACGDKWDRDDERLEQQITELAVTLPGVVGVKFTGDPRGYCVRLLTDPPVYNTWGGEEDGFGIA